MKKKNYIIVGVVILILVLGVSYYFYNKKKNETKSSSDTTKVINSFVNTDNGDENIDWSKYDTKEYTLTKSITITESGTYNLTGTIEDGLITIDTDGEVLLNLNGVNITNSKGPAIYVANASDVVINFTNDTI